MPKRFAGTATQQPAAGNRIAAASPSVATATPTTPASPKATPATAAAPAGPKGATATPVTTQPAGTVSHSPMSVDATTNGMVSAYSVDADRLMIKLNVSAIRRMLISVSVSSPQYRSAVSVTMMAYHNKERIYVRYLQPLIVATSTSLEVLQGTEVGIGEDALSFDDWPFKYTG